MKYFQNTISYLFGLMALGFITRIIIHIIHGEMFNGFKMYPIAAKAVGPSIQGWDNFILYIWLISLLLFIAVVIRYKKVEGK